MLSATSRYLHTDPPFPIPFYRLSCGNMEGVKLPTLPVNATVPQASAKRFPEASPPAPRGRTILGLGVSGRDVPSPACLSPGIRRTGTSTVSLWPAGEGRDKPVRTPSFCLCPPGLLAVLTHQGPPVSCWDPEPSSLPTKLLHLGVPRDPCKAAAAPSETGNVLVQASLGSSRSHPAVKHDACENTSTAETKSSSASHFTSPFPLSL